MSADRALRVLELAVLLIACRDLPGTFGSDPFARLAPAAFGLWIAGLIRGPRRASGGGDRAVALGLAALSGLSAVHALAHAALAIWIADALGAPRAAVPAALGWMPALGPLCASVGPGAAGFTRMAIAFAWLAFSWRRRRAH